MLRNCGLTDGNLSSAKRNRDIRASGTAWLDEGFALHQLSGHPVLLWSCECAGDCSRHSSGKNLERSIIHSLLGL